MRLVACVCGVAVLLCSFLAGAKGPDTAGQLRDLVDSYADRRGFNGTVLVAREGKVLLLVAHGSLGEAYRASGRRADARQHYQTALRLDPTSRSASEALAALQVDLPPH